eukprot:scaffold326_cov165-Amphora_coffeaeformis.AAC.4
MATTSLATPADGGNNNNSNNRSWLRLPSADYKLYCWKVRQGSIVRQGETVGLAVLREQEQKVATADEKPAAATTAYKRPTKRRRLAPSATTTTKPSSPVAAAPSIATATTNTTTHSSSSPKLPASVFKFLHPHAAAAPPKQKKEDTTKDHGHDETTAANAEREKSKNEDVSTKTSADTCHKRPAKPNESSSTPAAAGASSSSLSSSMVHILAETNGIIRFGKPAETTDPLVIGAIEECEHPTVVTGLCVVCGQAVGNNAKREDESYTDMMMKAENNIITSDDAAEVIAVEEQADSQDNTMTQVTVQGGVTMTISASEGQRMAQQNAERLQKLKKLSLVLDLDHTLLHATNSIGARQYQHREDVRTLILPVQIEGEPMTPQWQPQPPQQQAIWMQHFVKLRPHLREFLQTACDLYEVGVYTAGTRQYAEQITMLLARHMVGSRMDQTDMDHLRHQISHVQQQLERQQQQQQQREAEQQQQQQQQQSEDTPNEAPRKRVQFGDTNERTDAVTVETLRQLQKELEEAERMEHQALEFRQRLFGSRIVSRTDTDLGAHVKSIRRIFPCGGTMAVLVDDREDVWANAVDNETKGEPPDNLLLVRPYHWGPFAGFADVNNASGNDYGADQADGDDETADDKQLLWTSDVLRRIHEAYFETLEDNPQPGRRSVPEICRELPLPPRLSTAAARAPAPAPPANDGTTNSRHDTTANDTDIDEKKSTEDVDDDTKGSKMDARNDGVGENAQEDKDDESDEEDEDDLVAELEQEMMQG